MRIFISIILALVVSISAFAQNYANASEFYPEAPKESQVVFGKARFTVLTPRLVRMEWADDTQFEDRATMGVVNRNLPTPKFTTTESKSKVVIKTADMTLTYTGQEKFSESNLSIVFRMADPKAKKGVKTVIWKPGMDDSGNLLSTTRTLDKCSGFNTSESYDKGVLSRDGWAILDESERHVFVPVDSDWKYWAECRPEGERQDLYFFGYGHDYTDALADFTKVCGKIPLPPKYAFGYWWCRYWEYSDYELIDLAEHFKAYNIPMDVMIIDMDWHETWNKIAAATPAGVHSKRTGRDEFDQGIGWTGFTWKKELFPNPENFLTELHKRGIKTSLNLHFNNGIQPYEECYDRFVKDYTSRTADYDGPKDYVYSGPYKFAGNDYEVGKAGDKAPVPFRICQREWADAFFGSIIRPFDKQGVDFWWLDWQQWLESKYVKNLNNTFWLNYTFFNDKVRQTESLGNQAPRPMIYHRWGGIGSHRYQVGFSGDTYANWQVLSYLPYFTATASNAGYGYWGHDIGGHMQPKGVKHTDPELYTGWVQSGVFTPIFKTHSTKDMTMEKRFWVFPEHFDAMREAIRLRYDLAPYIYRAARQAYDTGVSMTRPLYYYWPEEEKAYTWKEEFMFGDDILATVVAKPVDPVTGLAERAMWFPEGTDWYDVSTGTMYKGGSEHTLLYTIDENPYFVKAGAVLPMSDPSIMTLQEQNPNMKLFVVPGLGESNTSFYEDDGQTQAYDTEYAVTEVTKVTTENQVVIKVAPRKGTFKGALPERRVSVVLDGFYAPTSVKVNGVEVPYSRFASYQHGDNESVWGYNGNQLQTNIWLSKTSADEALEIVCAFEGGATSELMNGKKGLINRVVTLTPEAKVRFAALKIKDFQLPSELMNIAQCGSYITENPSNAAKYLEAMDVKAMVDNINSWEKLSADFKAKVAAQTKFEDNSTDQLKVMSYNMRFVTEKDGNNQWKYRAKASPAMIRDYQPDVFGVQEAVAEQLEYMDSALVNYSYVGVGRDDGEKKGETMAIFYNTDKVELLNWGTFWLSPTFDKPSKGWGAGCRRTATWAQMKMKDSGKKFFYINTHLDHKSYEAQVKGMDMVLYRLGLLNTEAAPIILTGDFNVKPDSPVLNDLNVCMFDARKNADKTDSYGTFNGWGKQSSIIDYIYYYGFAECPSYETIVKKYEGVPFISDHYPIVSTLIF